MNGKSTVWIILFLFFLGAAGTGFYLNYQNSRKVEEQKLKVKEITDNLTTSRIQNQDLQKQISAKDEEITTLSEQRRTIQQQQQDALAALTEQLEGKDANIEAAIARQQQFQQQQDKSAAELQAKIDEIQTLTAQVATMTKLQKSLATLQQERNQLTAQVADQLSAKDVQNARLTSQLESLITERDKLKPQIEKLGQQLVQKDAVVQDLTIRLEQLTKEMLLAEALDQKKIPELTRQIAERTQQIAEITRQITTQESQKERLQEQITQITKQLETTILEKDELLLDLMKQRESEKKATEAEKKQLQQKITELEVSIGEKDDEISGFKVLIEEKEALLSELQRTFDADVAVREEKIKSLKQTLYEMDQKYQALTAQYTLREESLTSLQTEFQGLGEQLLTRASVSHQLDEAQAEIAVLKDNISAHESEYQQKIEAHNQMIAQLKDDIESGNMEKITIQSRLQEELDRSKAEYEERQQLQELALLKEKEIEALQTEAETYNKMTEILKEQIEAKNIEIKQVKERLTVKIVNKIVFASGRATINAEGQKVLDTVGEFLKQNLEDRQIQVGGHTDAVPIGSEFQEKYPTNWELSTARAVNVVRYLQKAADIRASKLSAVGYGEFQPVASNDTPEGRALNRRIEIVLIPELPESPFSQ